MSDNEMLSDLNKLSKGKKSGKATSTGSGGGYIFLWSEVWNYMISLFGKIISTKANRSGDSLTDTEINGITLLKEKTATKYLTDAGYEDIPSAGGSGDVVGPASSVDENIPIFDGVTGKLIKDSGVALSDKADASHTHSAADIVSGTIANAQISESSVTQHEAALSITESQIPDLNHNDVNAIHDNVAGEIAAITNKATPAAGDYLMIEDSAAGNAKKHILISSLPGSADPDAIHVNIDSEIAGIGIKASPVSADLLVIEDSEDAFNKKSIEIGSLPGGSGGLSQQEIENLIHF